ncbi:MAG: hypothetical protein IPH33_14670 [Bacteroidetes bacterium]|nr:hypothetical protein [Bacteroidota bacterium]
MSISVSSGFTGIVTIDSTTGIVNITNAAPAGIYTITVGGCLSQTFTLTVNTPLAEAKEVLLVHLM